MIQQRWWQRPGDGIIFMMTDPDHIARMLREGWREVEHPCNTGSDTITTDQPPPATPEPPLSAAAEAEALQERNDAARAWAMGKPQTSVAKPIKKIQRGGEV